MSNEIARAPARPPAPAPAIGHGRWSGRDDIAAASTVLVAATWLVHGFYNKLLHGSPRHLAIVQSVPGLSGVRGEHGLIVIGTFEVAIALWVLSGWAPRVCASIQTVTLLTMNAIELTYARPLLLWPAGLIPVNLLFLGAAWLAAQSPTPIGSRLRARLRRHPLPIVAHFRDALALTYAVPAEVLRPLLPPGLELEVVDGNGFVAVALVQTESLRPAGWPAALGQDFFLAGYRVFVTFRTPEGKRLRGLRILRSDADRARMVVGGNLLTHYNYHRCDAEIAAAGDRITASVRTPDGCGDLDVAARTGDGSLPDGSPFHSLREARRFAGPLPFTFDYEHETDAIVAIEARRTHWMPAPVNVDAHRVAFFDQPAFAGCRPVLAAAFHVRDVDYRWERGVRYALRPEPRERCHGVRQIVRFNWPFYATAVAGGALAAAAASLLPLTPAGRAVLYAATGLAAWWIAASLVASWIVYDASALMRGDWLKRLLSAPRRWIAIHAGFDEMTPLVRAQFPGSNGRTFDIFDANEMSEPSIARARQLTAATSESVDYRALPAAAASVDAVFLLLSAHELRTAAARRALLTEVRRVVAPNGVVVVAEHLRDVANFVAFGPGFLHFHARPAWLAGFAGAGLEVEREIRITPFVRVFLLRRPI